MPVIIRYEDVLSSLEVEALGAGRYTAPNVPMPYYRIFGGQLLAQLIAVASADVPGKQVRSLHVGFLREGDLEHPVEFEVRATQDGRTFAAREITGRQGGHIIVSGLVSLHVAEPGPEASEPAPDRGGPEAAAPVELSMIPWEVRMVGGVDLESRDAGPAELAFYTRTPPLDEDEHIHQALFAHATDLTLIGTSLRPLEGLGEADTPERVHTAVTTHTVWFHRPMRIDEWTLIDQRGVSLHGSRGFAQGRAWSLAGELLASFAQESMIRLRARPGEAV